MSHLESAIREGSSAPTAHSRSPPHPPAPHVMISALDTVSPSAAAHLTVTSSSSTSSSTSTSTSSASCKRGHADDHSVPKEAHPSKLHRAASYHSMYYC